MEEEQDDEIYCQKNCYTLGTFGGPFPGELERCIQKINEADLDLNFVPHLEYKQTMISSGESRWRNDARIPLDDKLYYDAAYSELFRVIEKNGFRGKVDISLAAEIDKTIFKDPTKTLSLISKIKRKRRDLGIKGNVTWSPNGNPDIGGETICKNQN